MIFLESITPMSINQKRFDELKREYFSQNIRCFNQMYQ